MSDVTPPPTRPSPEPQALAPGPAPGGRRFGRYLLQHSLGVGGMGVVWRAYDTELQREVALKEVHPGIAEDAEVRARFFREAAVAAKLHHPGLVGVHDAGEIDGRLYYTMDLVHGGSLAEYLQTTRADKVAGRPEGLRRLREEVELLADLAEAVGVAHRQGVLHRDLKPGNVLLEPAAGQERPRVRVGDFGLAKEMVVDPSGCVGPAQATLTAVGDVLGTPVYLSPEQARGDIGALGPGTDVWALGVMLYEVLTGRFPFTAARQTDLIERILLDDPVPPRVYRSDLPADLEAVCLKALEKERPRRYANAAEMAEDVQRWLRQEPVMARTVSRAARAWRWASRRRTVIAPLAVAGVLAAVVMAWGEGRSRHEAAIVESLFREAAGQAREFTHAVMSRDIGPEARRHLSEQPLGLIARILERNPRHGAALAWRGWIRHRLDGPASGREDLDRACATSPELDLVWYLRARHRLEEWRLGGLRYSTESGASGMRWEWVDRETAERRALRESALGDLAAMAAAAEHDPTLGPEDGLIARASALAFTDTARHGEEVLRLLEGIRAPPAEQVRAHVLVRRGDLDRALLALDALLSQWPNDLDGRITRAIVRRARGQSRAPPGSDGVEELGRALADLDFVAAHTLAIPETFLHRGLTYVARGNARAGRDPQAAGDYEAAIRDFEHTLEMEPGRADALIDLASAWIGLSRLSDLDETTRREAEARATAVLDDVLRAHPDDSAALQTAGFLWMHRMIAAPARGEDPAAHYRRAREHLDRAIERAPGDPDAWYTRAQVRLHRAEVLMDRGEDPREMLADAIADYDEALRLAPAFADALLERGSSWCLRATAERQAGGDPMPFLERGVADGERFLELRPASGLARRLLGRLRYGIAEARWQREPDVRAEFRAAIADLDRAIELDPLDAEAWHWRARALLMLAVLQDQHGEPSGDLFERAERDARAAIEAGTPWGHWALAQILRSTRRETEAIPAFEAFAAVFPGAADAALEELRSGAPSVYDPWVRSVNRAQALQKKGLELDSLPFWEAALAELRRRLTALEPAARQRWGTGGASASLLASLLRNTAVAECARAEGRLPAGSPVPGEAERRAHLDRALALIEEAHSLSPGPAGALRATGDYRVLEGEPRFEAVDGRK